jgi:CDP-diacylglycerol--glycerol-3-phosphate 3-phosphatidyltransferase
MLSAILGHELDKPLSLIIKKSILGRVHPIVLTLFGLLFNMFASGALIIGYWKSAALLILAAGLFDMLDGATARILKKTSRFGGFLDSVIDRYSDMSLLIALIIYYAGSRDMFMVVLCSIASLGTVLIPYTRARAEVYIKNCNVGIMERAERILLLAAGALFNCMETVLWLLAVFTHITVFHRIYYTWKEIQKLPQEQAASPECTFNTVSTEAERRS